MKRHLIFLYFLILISTQIVAQNTRITDKNNIGWISNTTTLKLSNKFGVHVDYQFRRDNYITDWQQSLIRTGLNYTLNPNVAFRIGYANVTTFNYGDIPIQAAGKTYPENRIFQMVALSNKHGIVDFSHRFMLEQRWVGRYSNPSLPKVDEYVFSNRLRYMYRMQLPLKGKSISDRTPYAALLDEIFVSFGKNVNANVFDQNRFGVLLGYRFSKVFRIEGGYFSQIVQLGRLVNGSNVFQYNNGFIINTFLNIDASKKK